MSNNTKDLITYIAAINFETCSLFMLSRVIIKYRILPSADVWYNFGNSGET